MRLLRQTVALEFPTSLQPVYARRSIELVSIGGARAVANRRSTAEADVERLRTIVADPSSTFIEVVCALPLSGGNGDAVVRIRDVVAALDAVDHVRPKLVLMGIEMPS